MADFDFFKRSDGYLQEDGFFRASADEILYWPKEDETGFVLKEPQAEEAAASVVSVTKAWRGKFWAAYIVLATAIIGLLLFILYSKGLPEGDNPILTAIIVIVLVLTATFIPLRFVFRLIRNWRISRLKTKIFDDLAGSSARRVDQDMPDPILLRPSVTGGHSHPNLIRRLRLVGGFVLFFVSAFSFSMLLSTLNPTKLGATALFLMLMLFGAWRLAVPEMRSLSPSPTKRRRKPRNKAEEDALRYQAEKSDVRNFIQWFRKDMGKGRKGGLVSRLLIFGVIVIGFTIYQRIDSLVDGGVSATSIDRSQVSAEYCKLLAGRHCIAVPDDLIIERWDKAPVVIFDYGSDVDRDTAEDWEDDILDRLQHRFRLAGFEDRVRGADVIPTDGTPYITIRFDNKDVPDALEGIVAGTWDTQNGIILAARYGFNLPALVELLEEFAGSGASWSKIRDERENIARFYAIQMLGLDPNWRPLPLTGFIGEDSVNLIPVIYRIHHDSRLTAGQTFQSQRDALDDIINDIFEDADAWTD